MRPLHCVPYYPAASCSKTKPGRDLAAALAMWSTTTISRNTKNFAKRTTTFCRIHPKAFGTETTQPQLRTDKVPLHPTRKKQGFVFLFLPQLIISLPHRFPSPPLPIGTTSRRLLSSLRFPFLATSHRPHLRFSPFPSSPLPFGISPLQHHFPWSPSPIPVTTSLHHHLASVQPVCFIVCAFLFCSVFSCDLSSSIEVHFVTSPLLFCEKMLSHRPPVTRSKFYFSVFVFCTVRLTVMWSSNLHHGHVNNFWIYCIDRTTNAQNLAGESICQKICKFWKM